MVHIVIPLENIDNGFLKGDLLIPKTVKGLMVFAHGSGSGRESPRNQYVANILNVNGFATFLVDLLTQGEQQSDLKSQKILDKYPSLTLNKFNIKLLATRLERVTTGLMEDMSKVKNLPIGYFGSSTGAAAAIEASTSDSLFGKVYAIVSRGGRPDLANDVSIKNVKASTLLIVGAKDSKAVIDLNKKVLNQLKNTKSKELAVIYDAGHLFEETGTIEQVADVTVKGFTKNL
ncbi:dienelactone hydrolase family protein [soil metagenome]